MAEPSPQVKYYGTNALKKAHTILHRALHNLEHDGSEIEAKRQIADVIRARYRSLGKSLKFKEIWLTDTVSYSQIGYRTLTVY